MSVKIGRRFFGRASSAALGLVRPQSTVSHAGGGPVNFFLAVFFLATTFRTLDFNQEPSG